MQPNVSDGPVSCFCVHTAEWPCAGWFWSVSRISLMLGSVGKVFLNGLPHLLPFIGLSQQDQVAVPGLTELCRRGAVVLETTSTVGCNGRGFNMHEGEIEGVGIYMVPETSYIHLHA